MSCRKFVKSIKYEMEKNLQIRIVFRKTEVILNLKI